MIMDGGYAVVRDTFPSIETFGRRFRRSSTLGLGTILGALLLAGSLNISNSTFAWADEACVAACKTEKDKCLSQMGTAEMCGADQKVCEKACEKK
jgi:hypothetical protein